MEGGGARDLVSESAAEGSDSLDLQVASEGEKEDEGRGSDNLLAFHRVEGDGFRDLLDLLAAFASGRKGARMVTRTLSLLGGRAPHSSSRNFFAFSSASAFLFLSAQLSSATRDRTSTWLLASASPPASAPTSSSPTRCAVSL
eukprot:768507-Hanusia_phi.AAC.4